MTLLDSSHCTVVAGGTSSVLGRIDVPVSSLPQPIEPIASPGIPSAP